MKRLLIIIISLFILTGCTDRGSETFKSKLGSIVEMLVYGQPEAVIQVKDPSFNSPFVEPTFDRADKEVEIIGSGMGFAVKENLILTNAHVLEDGSHFEVKLGELKYKAELVRQDKSKDLGLLRLIGGVVNVFQLSDSDAKVGQTVYLSEQAGSILKKDQSLVVGTITHPIKVNRLMKTSIPIKSGESGSPLLDADNQVVGMMAVTSNEDTTVSFAIPIELIQEFLVELDDVK